MYTYGFSSRASPSMPLLFNQPYSFWFFRFTRWFLICRTVLTRILILFASASSLWSQFATGYFSPILLFLDYILDHFPAFPLHWYHIHWLCIAIYPVCTKNPDGRKTRRDRPQISPFHLWFHFSPAFFWKQAACRPYLWVYVLVLGPLTDWLFLVGWLFWKITTRRKRPRIHCLKWASRFWNCKSYSNGSAWVKQWLR